ncbi:MAG: hypothetical protein HZA25_00625 [Candidatus Niyogibacteria bacterium]|nr:hypothetical protein [Candidatus Niyogibacteria bacterium]
MADSIIQIILYAQVFTVIANFVLGGFVLFKNSRSAANRVFALFALGAVGWNLSIFLTIIRVSPLWWGELAFSFAALMSAGLWWALNVFQERGHLSARHHAIPLVLGITFFILPLTGTMIIDVVPKDGYITGTFGSTYPLWVLYFLGSLSYIFVRTLWRSKKKFGPERVQLKYLTLGLLLFLLPFLATNLILPIVLDLYNLNNLGPLFTLPMIGVMAYGIIKHHLFDIQVVISRGAIFTFLFLIISFIYALLSGAVGSIFSGYLTYMVPSLIIALGFLPLKNFLEHATDAVFFRKRYRLEEVLVRLERVMYEAGLNMDCLLATFNQLIIETLRTEKGTILILIPKDSFITRQVIGGKDENVILGYDDPLVGALSRPGFMILDKDDILAHANHLGKHDPAHLHDLGLAEELEKIGFNLAIPIQAKGELIGVYLLGGKKSGDPFFGNDLKLLEHAVRAIGPLIENARMFEELKKLDDAKSNFIATASHQLRTPLSSIRWNLELLRDGEVSPAEKKTLSDSVYYNIIVTINRINSLLVVLDIEQGKLSLNASKNDIVAEVKASAEIVKKEAGIKAKAHITTAAPSLGMVYDREKVRAVLYVLMSNAFTYSGLDKPIEISIYSQFIAGEKRVMIAIADRGIGIDERTKPYMFYKLFRGEVARTVAPSGFGLNLFVAKSYIKAHGGDIWFESAGAGQGATFFISLPITTTEHEKK